MSCPYCQGKTDECFYVIFVFVLSLSLVAMAIMINECVDALRVLALREYEYYETLEEALAEQWAGSWCYNVNNSSFY